MIRGVNENVQEVQEPLPCSRSRRIARLFNRAKRRHFFCTQSVLPDRCIGCGICAGVCPCGVWTLKDNPVKIPMYSTGAQA
ncbi:4Fe-4S binding protein [Selenomonas sp.]|uniref:4Fe-4S binding protein n=1 Tax=Selenomonas sp. TaxID=2053611 RepID=UPI00344B5348